MPFAYTFRADDLDTIANQDKDLLENRDRELELYLNQPNVKLRRAAAQTISAGSNTLINFDTEDSDDSGFFPGSGTTLTVPSGLDGLYVIGCQLNWSGNPLTSTTRLLVNNLNIFSTNTSTPTKLQIGTGIYLNGGDTITMGCLYDAFSSPRTATATLWLTRVLA